MCEPFPPNLISNRLDLSTGWEFRGAEDNGAEWLGAMVPGCVHTDLIRHGLIPDPFYGRNELELQWIEERDWDYRLSFAVDASLLDEEHVDLVCEGLDTVASVRLNGEIILENENMFHRHRLPVKGRLKAGGNALEIRFGSAMKYIRTHRLDFVGRDICDPRGGSPRIRKQPCQFGWDWGPRFVTCGIWRPIFLEGWSGNRIESVRIEQKHARGSVGLRFLPELERADNTARFRATVSLNGETVAAGEFQTSDFTLEVPNPLLWWPAGQGEQPLYEASVELVREGAPISIWTRRIGLRTIELDREPDGLDVKGVGGIALNRFGFRVNGRLIFSKGGNWIPAHSFVAGLTRADYEPLLRSMVDANMNMVRLWGGGVYEHEAFYDLCDEMGLMVWHDLMFACALYPSDDAFVASVEREARDQVTRVRHHASLALWCGNNEVTSIHNETMRKDAKLREGYARVFLIALPPVVRGCDPVTPYIHSSPCHPVAEIPETRPPSHDEHDWTVWHGRASVDHFEKTQHLFVSEFGLQSYPSPAVAATFCPPEELNILSPVFEAHQKNTAGNEIIFHYSAKLFRYPGDYRGASYLSQLNQAHCMQVAIEHFRRQQPQCLGALYWQINDCWPVASWSSLEFGGNWKALHHYARRFFAPRLVSIKLHGEEAAGVGNYQRNTRGVAELWTVSDAPEKRTAEVSWQLVTLKGEPLAQGRERSVLHYGEAVSRRTLDLTAELDRVGKENAVLLARLTDADTGEELSRNAALFTAPRFLQLSREPIQQAKTWRSPHELELTLQAPVFHYGVCIEPQRDAVVSDNYFHLSPGETRVVKIRYANEQGANGPEPRVFSLIDTY
jgi:beta-mannosidase